MRKMIIAFAMVVLFSALMVVSGCGGDKSAGGGGASAALLPMLPDNATAVLVINFDKLAKLEFFDKVLQDADKKSGDLPGKIFENYQEFVTKTGIDAKKDIHAMALGFYGKIDPVSKPEMAFLLSLNYKKDLLLGVMNGLDKVTKDAYKDLEVFKIKEEDGKEMGLSFISNNLIAGGTPTILNRLIDLSKGTGKNIMSAGIMKEHLKNLNTGAISSFVLAFPEDLKKVQDSGMFKLDLSKAEAITGYVDYENKTWNVEIKLISPNEEGNQQLVNTINGLKAMAGALGPEVAELANNMTLSASADSVKLEISITEELVEKLKTKVQEKTQGMIPPPPADESTETSEESMESGQE